MSTETLTVAAIQCALSGTREANVETVVKHVRAAAAKGAQVILPPELFRNREICVGLDVVSRCSGTLLVGPRKPIMAIGIYEGSAKLEQFK